MLVFISIKCIGKKKVVVWYLHESGKAEENAVNVSVTLFMAYPNVHLFAFITTKKYQEKMQRN